MANVRASNIFEQEYEKFVRFGDSLIARSGKLSELAQQLESTLVEAGKSEDSADGKRVSKCVQNLESAVETLEQQYEKCELVKLDVSDLSSPDLGEPRKQEFPDLTTAPCKHLVELARSEVELNPRSSPHMRAFANVRLEDAEVGVHRVLVDAGMTAPIQVETVDLGEGKLKKFPFIKLSAWVQHLLDTDRLSRQMVGVPTITKMKLVLKEFWRRFQAVNPTHGVFGLEREGALSLDTCIPFYSHTDEGRSYKHLPLWILSSHGAIGRGTRSYLASGKHKAPLRRNAMGMNFAGKTWSTNFIFASALQTVTAECPEAIAKLVEQYAADVRMLLYTGIFSRDGQTHVTFAHIGTKGDLPALVRLGSLKRSFYNVPRGASSKKACQGICHLCLGGREADPSRGVVALPYEDVGPRAGWIATIGQSIPWDNTPPILEGLPLNQEDQIRFFNTDLWHNAHLGVCKHFTASAFVAFVESDLACIPVGSVETRFRWMSQIYKAYFRSITAGATRALNVALAVMYGSGFWIRSDKGLRLADLLFRFLALYANCAHETLLQRKRRFSMVPKLHMIAHCAVELQRQAATGEWVQNPLSLTNQMQEDFIGRPSRISRRVSIRSIHRSLLMRALIVYQDSLRNSDVDPRGMDGYSDL
eukprot:s815_g16.t1